MQKIKPKRAGRDMRYQQTNISGDVLRKYVENKPPKVYKGISPSSLGGCMRSHYWKIKGVPSTTPPNFGALVNFEVGHAWEAMLAKAYEADGSLVKWFQDGVDEAFYDEDTMLTGTPDLIVKEGKVTKIVDSKTVNSAYFRYAKMKGFDAWVKDNMNYVYQQVAYVYLAQKNGYPDITTAVLSFASKDDGYIGMEFEIEASDDLIQDVIKRAKKLKDFLDKDELPPCTCTGWLVGYCSMGDPNTQEPNKKKKIVNTICCEELIEKARLAGKKPY